MQRELILKTKDFPVKIRDIHKIEKKVPSGLVFLAMKIKRNFQSMYQKVVKGDKHIDLLLIGKGEKKHCVLIKDFNTFIYDYTLHRGRKYFCRY